MPSLERGLVHRRLLFRLAAACAACGQPHGAQHASSQLACSPDPMSGESFESGYFQALECKKGHGTRKGRATEEVIAALRDTTALHLTGMWCAPGLRAPALCCTGIWRHEPRTSTTAGLRSSWSQVRSDGRRSAPRWGTRAAAVTVPTRQGRFGASCHVVGQKQRPTKKKARTIKA